ncbi:hypothetical protein EGW08_008454 [Elysia chlorotica]|uniref:Choline/carnitine acyltransferase domain-containing protein n=1 Tax=Elysia chlorotica TaxID=188477 RepID=A0A3S1BHI9_ELYCH|nr:hypothetical protein EGW08_008454 [Elysia chlorotica]
MSKSGNFRFPGTAVSTTRVSTKPDPDRHIEVRGSHRRSSMQRQVIPSLSSAPSHSHTGHAIHFQVEDPGQGGKTAKQTLSRRLVMSSIASLHELTDILDFKRKSTIVPKESIDHGKIRFAGDLMLSGSTTFAEGEMETLNFVESGLELCSGQTSRVCQPGDLSPDAIDDLWPWPWLSPKLTGTEYASSGAQPQTFRLQEQLPVCPLLTLTQALQAYTRSLRLFLKPQQFEHVQKLLDEFAKSNGQDFQESIAQEYRRQSLRDGTVSMGWLPHQVPKVTRCLTRLEAPLGNAAILPLAMWDLWPARDESQIDRAVILIQSCTEFARLIHSERLKVLEDEHGYPQCNHQFRKLFCSSKIPGTPTDGTHCFFKTMFEHSPRSTPRHIVVIRRGQMFSLDILCEQFLTIPALELRLSLKKIIEIADENTQILSSGVGILSSIDRDKWSETRLRLMETSEDNRECLQKLEEAMFVLTLDHMNGRAPDRLVGEALFADGFNRWYDKGLAFYMYRNGLFTVNVCSSLVDSSIVNHLLRFIHIRILEDTEKWDDEVYRKASRISRCVSSEVVNVNKTLSRISDMILDQYSCSTVEASVASQNERSHLCALLFDTDDDIERTISDAKISFAELSEDLSSATCQFYGFELDLLEDNDINVDAFAHMAMQLTFFKMYYRHPAVGTKVSMRRFYHGHFDTLITSTEESMAWCRAMLSEDSSLDHRRRLFLAAVGKHVQGLEEVRSGLGCFNHLSTLHEMAILEGDHQSADTLTDLSELAAGSPESLDMSCEGCAVHESLGVPVVVPPTLYSYGLGYLLARSLAVFTVCAWASYPGTCAENFARSLHSCIADLQKFLQRL